VVIVDEASQADLNALIPLYLGKQVIVVGDHEQVTPLGVGQGQAMLNNLRQAMLQDIPNAHLFDHLCSIYDIGRQSFGDAIRLVEHFRCVPEIIAFSNQLSYEGTIRPLRESNSTDIKPACVACRVDGIREGDTNQTEARRIIDTIKAMLRHPTYAGKTIGVISMLGEAQALLIQSLLHKEIPGVEIANRRIQAGISGEFQGDERDIIFLSMVDSARPRRDAAHDWGRRFRTDQEALQRRCQPGTRSVVGGSLLRSRSPPAGERHPAETASTRPGPVSLPAGERAGGRQDRVAVRAGCAEALDGRGFPGQVAVAGRLLPDRHGRRRRRKATGHRMRR
jgi:hypothetical protein